MTGEVTQLGYCEIGGTRDDGFVLKPGKVVAHTPTQRLLFIPSLSYISIIGGTFVFKIRIKGDFKGEGYCLTMQQ